MADDWEIADESARLPHRPPGAEDTAVVRFERVGLRYDVGPEVFRDMSFTLPAGSFHFLTGGSGAGKSTVLGLCYLSLRPTRGLVTLFGHDVSRAPTRLLPRLRRRLGVVFQDFRLIEHLSAMDNVALPLRVAGVPEPDIRRHVPELLAWVGLADHLEARPSTLSGGQKQRVAIARAVINRPDLLLADEPTGNVDDRIAMRLLHLFEELNKLGTTVLIATHNEQLVRRFAHPCLQLNHGALTLRQPEPPQPRPGPRPAGGLQGGRMDRP
ncbi:cell division ATP-binding protein FtsE [Roseospira visakhapatnamensis]|uniref:Cell division ATP-binding protein FtsE n=1 Tax=Roseospira visakhapatnamensis TaxID=390880 RepID=A0A7W6RD32_9PROT|nr:cell division ATP-binding protein FtsE [Roseospira visakhapatnamensis]MBB4266320.1 cell division transport system ATP-binding protein [Roseospira visakhapatnamensis]